MNGINGEQRKGALANASDGPSELLVCAVEAGRSKLGRGRVVLVALTVLLGLGNAERAARFEYRRNVGAGRPRPGLVGGLFRW